jgi:hypothetical protein
MIRIIPYIITLVIFFGWMSVSRAQSDPKNPVQSIKSVNPSRFDHPLNQPDAKLTAEQKAAIENADHSNPAKPPSAAPDQKKTMADPETERAPVTANPEPKQAPPDISSSTSGKSIQPEGGKPESVTDYRAIKGSDSLQMEPTPKVPVTDYRNTNGPDDQPPGKEIPQSNDTGVSNSRK